MLEWADIFIPDAKLVGADWISAECSSESKEDGKKHRTLISVQGTKFTPETSEVDLTFWNQKQACIPPSASIL